MRITFRQQPRPPRHPLAYRFVGAARRHVRLPASWRLFRIRAHTLPMAIRLWQREWGRFPQMYPCPKRARRCLYRLHQQVCRRGRCARMASRRRCLPWKSHTDDVLSGARHGPGDFPAQESDAEKGTRIAFQRMKTTTIPITTASIRRSSIWTIVNKLEEYKNQEPGPVRRGIGIGLLLV